VPSNKQKEGGGEGARMPVIILCNTSCLWTHHVSIKSFICKILPCRWTTHSF